MTAALRMVYPVHTLQHHYDMVDLLLHTDSLLKTIPESRIAEFEDKIQRRIVTEKKYRPRSDHLEINGNNYAPTKETYREFIHTKDDILFYPGRIGVRKGQLLFAQRIDRELIHKHNLTVVFSGAKGELGYANETFSELEKKGIPYQYVGFIDKGRMMDYYIRAKVNGEFLSVYSSRSHSCFADNLVRVIVLLSYDDPGPRVLYEGLYGNTPFITLPSVTLGKDETPAISFFQFLIPTECVVSFSNNSETRLEPFGRRLKNEQADDLNQVLEGSLTTC